MGEVVSLPPQDQGFTHPRSPSDPWMLKKKKKKVKVMTRHIYRISAIIAVERWARSRWTASIMMDEDGDSSQESCRNLASAHSAMTPLVTI